MKTGSVDDPKKPQVTQPPTKITILHQDPRIIVINQRLKPIPIDPKASFKPTIITIDRIPSPTNIREKEPPT